MSVPTHRPTACLADKISSEPATCLPTFLGHHRQRSLSPQRSRLPAPQGRGVATQLSSTPPSNSNSLGRQGRSQQGTGAAKEKPVLWFRSASTAQCPARAGLPNKG